jgi:hypothetical protein
MNKCILVTVCFLGVIQTEAYVIHKEVAGEDWTEVGLPPFDECMLTWNASRPQKGGYHFYVSVKTEQWSPLLLYASWGSAGQMSYDHKTSEAHIYQDVLTVLGKEKATGFRIKIVPEEGAPIDAIRGLHIYINEPYAETTGRNTSNYASIQIPVSGLSQIALDHIRHMDLCSPTSTTAVTRYLSGDASIDPLLFASQSWDKGFNIFGNWVFSVAQSSVILGPAWAAWVERLSGFRDIHQRLQQGTPVIVSIRGPLPGSALPYSKGHLVAVTGYDSEHQRVLCMDPAFPSNEETLVQYDLDEFITAWNRRGRVAYIFEKKQ